MARFLTFLLICFSPLSYGNNLDQLKSIATSAFIEEFGPTQVNIDIEIDPPSCLRTGYNKKSGKVVFCPGKNTINSGLDSVDVINHEFFHALLCGTRPELCLDPAKDFIHEALADAFSYKLNPDKYFGENCYKDHAYIRSYKTSWLPTLVDSDHERGQALASLIIDSARPLKEFLELFRDDFSSDVEVQVIGRESSSLNRYRLRSDEVLELKFIFSTGLQVHEVQWTHPAGVVDETIGNHSFIKVTDSFKSGKSYARFIGTNGKELGRKSFYFGKLR